jgi:hypothetical protein
MVSPLLLPVQYDGADMPPATYVAATIHVRIAATRASSSEAHDHLRTCLRVFDQNSATNYAVRKASIVIEALMKRMNVAFSPSDTTRSGPSDTSSNYHLTSTSENASDPREGPLTNRSMDISPYHQNVGDYNNPEPTMVAGQFVPGLDVDTIIHSFMQEQQYNQADAAFMPMMNPANNHQMRHNDGGLSAAQRPDSSEDSGMFDDALFGFNASGYDWYYPNVMHP